MSCYISADVSLRNYPHTVGSDVGQINEVTLRQARLVLGWVIVTPGLTPDVGNLSQSNQPPMSTQPGHPSVGRCNEYRPKGGDALWLESKAGMAIGLCFGGR